MVCLEEVSVTIGPRGYEATQSRMQEILAKLRSIRPEPERALPPPGPTPMAGEIGGNSFAPLNPFGPQTETTVNRAPQGLQSMIAAAATKAGLDPVLFESLVQAESDFNPSVVSPKGATGLTQLMPSTARSLGVTDPLDPAQNLAGGAKYLAGLLKRFGGDERLALAAYNAGPGAVNRYNGIPPFPETQHYVDRIMTRVGSLRGKP